MADRKVKQWITVHGRHIPIFEGESKADAVKRIKGELKEGARKGKEKQQEMHSKDKQAKKEAFDKAREKQKKKHQAMEKDPTERRKEAYKKAAEDTIEKKQAFEDAMSGKVKAKFRKKHMNESEFKDIMSNEDSATRRQKLGSFMFHATPGAVVDTGTGYKVTMGEDGLWKDSNGEHHLTDDLVKQLSHYHKMTAADRKEWNNQKAKKKSFEEATARLKAKETPQQRLKTLQEHDYEELTSAEKKELKSLQEKAYKGELNKKASAPSAGSDAMARTASRLQKKGINTPESIEKHLRELSPVRRNRLAKELGIEGRGDDKIKAMTQKINEQMGGHKYTVTARGKDQQFHDVKAFDTPKEADDYISSQVKNGNGTIQDYNVKHNGKSGNWQDKDAEDKAKQIATHQKAADERNEKISSSVNRSGKSLGEKAEDAKENAKLRAELAQEEHFKKQGQSSWEPKEGDRVSNVGYNEAMNKLFNAPEGTVIQMSNHNLGDYEGEYTKQADGSWVGSQKYKSNRRTPPTVKTAEGFAMHVQGNDVKVLSGGQAKSSNSSANKKEPAKMSKYNAENKTPVGHQKWKEVLSDLSTKTHPNDVDYMMAQIDDGKTIDKIHALLGRVDNKEGYPLPGREGLHYKDVSPEVKRKIIDLIKSYAKDRR